MKKEKIILRDITIADSNTIFRLRSDERVNRYLSRQVAGSEQDAVAFIEMIIRGIRESNWKYWIIEEKSGATVGTICLYNFSANNKTAEIGFELLPEYQGLGYAFEAVIKVIRYTWEKLNLENLVAFPHKENISSIRLLEKSGFILSVHQPEDLPPDHICYCLEKS